MEPVGRVVEEAATRQVSVSTNSLARFVADGSAMAAGLLAAIVTARWLGPAGKGVYSSLALLVSVGAGVATAGLGQAAVMEVRRHGRQRQAVLGTLALAGLALAVVVSGLLLAGGLAWLGQEGLIAVLAGAATVPLIVLGNVLGGVLDAHGSIVRSSVGFGLSSVVGALAVVALVAGADGGVSGAMIAGVIGACSSVLLFAFLIRRDRIPWQPRVDLAVLRRSLRYGLRVQGASLLQLATARIDLLLVLVLAGETAAGQYSIGLTLALVVSAVPRAVAYGAFPALASMTAGGADELARITRIAMLPTIAVAVVLGASVPMLVPALFGPAFEESITPALVLVGSGALFGLQSLLARGRAGLDEAGVTLASFAASTVLLVAADLLLVPIGGMLAAAWVAVLSPLVGAVVCLAGPAAGRLDLRAFRPRADDLRALRAVLRQRRRP